MAKGKVKRDKQVVELVDKKRTRCIVMNPMARNA